MNNLKTRETSTVKIHDEKIQSVSTKLSERMNIPYEKAEFEVKLGVINALLLNKHRAKKTTYK